MGEKKPLNYWDNSAGNTKNALQTKLNQDCHETIADFSLTQNKMHLYIQYKQPDLLYQNQQINSLMQSKRTAVE